MECYFYINQQTVLHFDLDNKTPKYLQLAATIQNAVQKRALRKGQKLYYGMAQTPGCPIKKHTLQKAFENLSKKGILTAGFYQGFYILSSPGK